jgi:hypothetical protein
MSIMGTCTGMPRLAVDDQSDIGTGATDVERDDIRVTGTSRKVSSGDDATCGTRQQGVNR